MSVTNSPDNKADFDGDEMNLKLHLDDYERETFKPLAPYYGVMDTQHPYRVSGNVKIPGPILQTMGNWMHEGE